MLAYYVWINANVKVNVHVNDNDDGMMTGW